MSKPKEGEIQKSEKISNMARMLEKQMGVSSDELDNKRKMLSDIYDNNNNGDNNINNDCNNNVTDLIDSQPVINKKKKQKRSFSLDV